MLILLPGVRDQIVAHALRGLPHEACGLFAAEPDGQGIHTFYPMRNAAESSRIYRLDPAEMRALEEQADAAGARIVGVMHSHTHTTAYPSPTDVADAAAFDPFGAWHHLIVSLKDPIPVMRCYRLVEGIIVEDELRLG